VLGWRNSGRGWYNWQGTRGFEAGKGGGSSSRQGGFLQLRGRLCKKQATGESNLKNFNRTDFGQKWGRLFNLGPMVGRLKKSEKKDGRTPGGRMGGYQGELQIGQWEGPPSARCTLENH